MRISWMQDTKLVSGHEYFCGNVARDLTKCPAYLRVTGNDYQSTVKAHQNGWAITMGDSVCPEHLPDAQKTIRKGK